MAGELFRPQAPADDERHWLHGGQHPLRAGADAAVLVFFRVLQGAAGGSLQPTTRAIMLETFPREERGHAMALWGVGIVIAPIVAPMLGGWLTTDYSWRWVFFINRAHQPSRTCFSFGLTFLILRTFAAARRASITGAWGCWRWESRRLQIVFDKGQEDDWFSSHFIVAMLVIAAVGLISFTIWELHTRHPVVHFHLLRYRTFATGTSLSLVLFFSIYGSIVLLPLFMQELLGFPAVTAGVWNAPRGMATLVLMPLAGYLIGKRWDMRALLTGGLVVTGIGAYMFSYLNLNAGPWNFLWPQTVMGVGLSFMFVPLATLTVDPIPQEEMGYATSLIALSRNLGAGIGISVFTSFVARRTQFHQARLAASMPGEPGLLSNTLSGLQGYLGHQGDGPVLATHQALAMIYGQLQQEAAALSYLDGFRIMAILLFLAIPFVWIMKKPHFRPHNGGAK